MVVLSKDGKTYNRKVHKLVANTFLPDIEYECIDHISGDCLDNNLANLEKVSWMRIIVGQLQMVKEQVAKRFKNTTKMVYLSKSI